tara:strand:- start:4516 stop:5145 length:630 start_codon:yes stop_codon:yes gene_type:complete
MGDLFNTIKEFYPFLLLLIPGFVLMSTFYWFADKTTPGQFQLTIQAMFSGLVIQVGVHWTKSILLIIGSYWSAGAWTEWSSLTLSLFAGVAGGLWLSYLSTNDTIYRLARKLNITSKASIDDANHVYRSQGQRPIVLQLNDGARLMGFYSVFPNSHQAGSFLIDEPVWIDDKDELYPCTTTASIFIDSSSVSWVEFLKTDQETEAMTHG